MRDVLNSSLDLANLEVIDGGHLTVAHAVTEELTGELLWGGGLCLEGVDFLISLRGGGHLLGVE